jgi:flagellar protein FliS
MSVTAERAAAAYRTTQVESRSPVELVVMLHDGLVRHLTRTRDAMASGDLVTKRTALTKALAILSELQNTLNRERGGELAAQLDGLYTYIHGRLLEANINRQSKGFDEALKLVVPLRDAWAHIAMSAPDVKVTA